MNTNHLARLATIGLLLMGSAQAALAQTATARPGTAAPTFKEQTSEGSITLAVRPVWKDSTMVFDIAADTHSGDLGSLDLRKLVRLQLDGREIEPVAATGLDGHHGKATVTFRLAAAPETFALLIREVGDVPERVLKWPGDQDNNQ